jgi:hypothetical protein
MKNQDEHGLIFTLADIRKQLEICKQIGIPVKDWVEILQTTPAHAAVLKRLIEAGEIVIE